LLQNTLDLQIIKFSSFLGFALKLPKLDTPVWQTGQSVFSSLAKFGHQQVPMRTKPPVDNNALGGFLSPNKHHRSAPRQDQTASHRQTLSLGRRLFTVGRCRGGGEASPSSSSLHEGRHHRQAKTSLNNLSKNQPEHHSPHCRGGPRE
jgi:hypothetical protein